MTLVEIHVIPCELKYLAPVHTSAQGGDDNRFQVRCAVLEEDLDLVGHE
jgi:hypothetical protein